jgi:hypothetical protein
MQKIYISYEDGVNMKNIIKTQLISITDFFINGVSNIKKINDSTVENTMNNIKKLIEQYQNQSRKIVFNSPIKCTICKNTNDITNCEIIGIILDKNNKFEINFGDKIELFDTNELEIKSTLQEGGVNPKNKQTKAKILSISSSSDYGICE